MTKATTSAVDFLTHVAGETELFETDGVTVEIRGIPLVKFQKLMEQYKEDNAELTIQMIMEGMVSPRLDDAQIEQFRNTGMPGPLTRIVTRIIAISGAGKDDGPLAPGGGLSS